MKRTNFEKKKMIALTNEQEEPYQKTKNYSICKKYFVRKYSNDRNIAKLYSNDRNSTKLETVANGKTASKRDHYLKKKDEKVIGLTKYESGRKILIEFAALRQKPYNLIDSNNENKKNTKRYEKKNA